MSSEDKEEMEEIKEYLFIVFSILKILCIVIVCYIDNFFNKESAWWMRAIVDFSIIFFLYVILEKIRKKEIHEIEVLFNFSDFADLMEIKVKEWADVYGKMSTRDFFKFKEKYSNYSKILYYMDNKLINGDFACNKDLEKETKEYRDLVRYKILDMAALFVVAIAKYPIYKKKLWQGDASIEKKLNAIHMNIVLKKFLFLYKAYFDSKKIDEIYLPELLIIGDMSDKDYAYQIIYDALKKQLLGKNS